MSSIPSISSTINNPDFSGRTTTADNSQNVAQINTWSMWTTTPQQFSSVYCSAVTTTDACGNTETNDYSSCGALVYSQWSSVPKANGTGLWEGGNIQYGADGSTASMYWTNNTSNGETCPLTCYEVEKTAAGCVTYTDYTIDYGDINPNTNYEVDTQTNYDADGSTVCTVSHWYAASMNTADTEVITTTDACGNATVQNYTTVNVNGTYTNVLTSDSWTKVNGSSGSDTCNASGTVVSSNAQLGSSAACITYGNQNVTVTATEGCGVTDSITVGNGNNQITLGQGNDCVTAGNGNDCVTTGKGNNTVTLGCGTDTINTNGGCNTLNLGAGQYAINNNCGTESVNLSKVNSSQLWFTEKGGNLVISVLGSKESITVANWAANEQLCNVSTADCKSISGAGIAQMVQAMACFAPPTAGQTCYTAAEQKALAPQLAANWH